MNGFFITGTDTDIGKTIVTAAITALLRDAGYNALPMKPIQTGCNAEGKWLDAIDLEFVLIACGISAPAAQKKDLCPIRLKHPCSPHLAAELEGITLSRENIMMAYTKLRNKNITVIAEGAGGILVPISVQFSMRDMAKMFALPVIIVARPVLGTINHTLLTIETLKNSGIDVAGVVFCESILGNNGYIEKDNRAIISRISGVPILGILPYRADMTTLSTSPVAFSIYAKKNLTGFSQLI